MWNFQLLSGQTVKKLIGESKQITLEASHLEKSTKVFKNLKLAKKEYFFLILLKII